MPVHLAVLAVEVLADVRDDRLDLAGHGDAHLRGLAIARRMDRQGSDAEGDEDRGRDGGRKHGKQCRVDAALPARPIPAGRAGASRTHSYLTGPAAPGGESPFTTPLTTADPAPGRDPLSRSHPHRLTGERRARL